tara:strand:+ start:3317 stop:3511 length:195 start_codon:yes stop_codon:yes gene_type:complete
MYSQEKIQTPVSRRPFQEKRPDFPHFLEDPALKFVIFFQVSKGNPFKTLTPAFFAVFAALFRLC